MGGDSVVYDDVNSQYWVQDLSLFTSQDYSTQLTGISALNQPGAEFGGVSGWHMALFDEMELLWAYSASDLEQAFEPSKVITRYGGRDYYYGRYDLEESAGRHYFAVFARYYSSGSLSKQPLLYYDADDAAQLSDTGAWVTAPAPAPVPEPATMLLLGSGLVGLTGIRRKFKKR